jgi:hypothetical protein
MDAQLLALENDIINYNKVKDTVIGKIYREGYMTEKEANEFMERNQILVYKGNWFSGWFEKNVSQIEKDKEKYFMRIIEVNDKDFDLEDTAVRNRRMKMGVYKTVFKRMLSKDFPEIMKKKEFDINEITFHFTDDDILDSMQLMFPSYELKVKYEDEHKDFLEEAHNLAQSIGFVKGILLSIEE